jgi:hypothetical protein
MCHTPAAGGSSDQWELLSALKTPLYGLPSSPVLPHGLLHNAAGWVPGVPAALPAFLAVVFEPSRPPPPPALGLGLLLTLIG